jgi:hypothetical protein
LSTVRSRSRPSDPNSGDGRVGGRLAGAPRPPRAAGIAGPGQGQAGQGSPRRPRRGLALRRLGRAGYLPTGDRPGRYLAGRRVPSQGARRARPGQAPGHRPGRSDPGQHLHLSVLRPRSLSVPGAVTRTGLGSEQAGLRSRWAPGVRRVERTRPPTYLRTPVTASTLHANRKTAPASGEWFTGAVCLPPAGGA